MNDQQIIDRLADLRESAPEGTVGKVLVATGLADGYITRESPLGLLYVAFNDRGVSALTLADDRDAFLGWFEETFHRDAYPVPSAPDQIERNLDRALVEGRPGRLPLDLEGLTEFQAAVLRKAADIPRGEVRPYGWIAREIGRPKAVRAVGSALANNPVPLIVPCHRVVRSDGTLGNYSLGGPDNKRFLLEDEGLDLDAYQALASRHITYTGSATTKIFCNPTCRHAQRTLDKYTREFRSEAQAREAGYRPCKVCRPAAAA